MGSFLIEVENIENLPTQVFVTNIQGQEVYRNKVNLTNQVAVELANPASGIYFLHIQNEKTITMKKNVIQ
jgi:hypothetical protein